MRNQSVGVTRPVAVILLGDPIVSLRFGRHEPPIGTIRRLPVPLLRDAATGQPVESGPEIDDPRTRTEYRRRRSDRRYAVSKRRLCKAELRRQNCTIRIRMLARPNSPGSLIGSPYASAEGR
jgi:hypothetical protein